MPRQGTWQPGLTEDERKLARKIAGTFPVKVAENEAVKFALKKTAQELGVEA